MSRRRGFPKKGRWIDPQDFRDLRRQSGLTRAQAGEALDVTQRTIQNWETGGARVPWMAYRMLRILCGYALPGYQWDGWTLYGDKLYNPAGRSFDSASLQYLELVFSQARLWRQMYARSGVQKAAETIIPFPDRRRTPAEAPKPPQAQPKQIGGTR